MLLLLLFHSLDTTLRAITLDLCSIVLRGLILALESDDAYHKQVEETLEKVEVQLAAKLRDVVYKNDIFLEMFEEEYHRLEGQNLRVNNLASEPTLYLPPANSSISNITLSQRLPYGNDEKIRRVSNCFLLLNISFVFRVSNSTSFSVN